MKEALPCSIAKASMPDEFDEEGLLGDGDEEEAGEGDANKAEAVVGETSALPFFPAEAPEGQAREWLNLFGSTAKQVVDFYPGSGVLALACCRHSFNYLGFVSSSLQKEICKQQVLLSITLELILNKRDGFTTSRFLSRERSLGGESASGLEAEVLAAGGLTPSTPKAATPCKTSEAATPVEPSEPAGTPSVSKPKAARSVSSSSSSS